MGKRSRTNDLGAGNKGSKYTSKQNHIIVLQIPDARISVKNPGKARKLNLPLSAFSVDYCLSRN